MLTCAGHGTVAGEHREAQAIRILVDITHPAHVHFFRHAMELWRGAGHELCVTARRKDITYELLDALGIEFEDLGPARSGLLGLAVELPVRTARLLRRVRRFRPDVMTAIGGVFIAQAGWLSGVPSVVFYDTENATLSNLLTYPFCTTVSTPRCYEGWVPSKKHVTYHGYHELAYTHPKRFTPDDSVLQRFGLTRDEPFVIVRLVSWGAAHDVRDYGFSGLERVVRTLEPYGRVLISSERALPRELEPLRLSAEPELVHHLLAFARLFIGESRPWRARARPSGRRRSSSRPRSAATRTSRRNAMASPSRSATRRPRRVSLSPRPSRSWRTLVPVPAGPRGAANSSKKPST